MREALRTAELPSIEADGQISQTAISPHRLKKNTDKNVRPITFRDLAKFVWPNKAEKHLSHLTGYNERTCRRWLSNVSEPPAEALSIILYEIMRRFHQR